MDTPPPLPPSESTTPPTPPSESTPPPPSEQHKVLERKMAFELPDNALDVEDENKTSSTDMPVMTKNVEVSTDKRDVLTNGDLQLRIDENKKEEEEEEAALDEEFIKVDRESFNIKESSDFQTNVVVEGQIPSAQTTSPLLNNELEEAQKRIEKLKLELDTVVHELKSSECEKAQFQGEIKAANEKIKEKEKNSEALELDLRRLKEEALEAETKYNSQLHSLREALEAQEAKCRELNEIKETFHGISIELESSRNKIENLELNLSLSTEEAVKYEKLCKEKGLYAESETQRAFEFEKMLEAANLNTKDMDNKISIMQGELKELHERNLENQQIKKALDSTVSELSEVREELGLSKSRVSELEQKASSGVATIEKLTQELNQRKVSEDKLQNDLTALESKLTASKEELQAVVSSLENVESKYQDELKTRERFESSLKGQDVQILNLQEQLLKVNEEKEVLQAMSEELSTGLANAKEMCANLEDKLSMSDQNFSKTDALLSQAMIYNSELEQKMKSLEEFHRESSMTAESASQRNFHLEDLIRSSHAAEDEVKTQLRETEMKLISAEKRNVELEQQLNLTDLKCNEKDSELIELHHKISELSGILKGLEEEAALSKCHFQAYEDRVSQLESSLSKSSNSNSELEQEIKDLIEKCSEHQIRADSKHQRTLELEDLVQISHSKSTDAEKKVAEIGLELEATKYRVRELEEQLDIGYVKYKDTEAELKQSQGKVSELAAALEVFQVKSSSLEAALTSATEKERELTDLLKLVTEEKTKTEELFEHSTKKLLEAEHQVESLQNELKLEKDKTRDAKEELEASGVRENEILQKLRTTEEQLESQGKKIEEATTRSLELECLHESKSKDSELKLQEMLTSLSQKDAEVTLLYEKLKSIEEQATIYQDQAAEATEWAVSLKSELDSSTMAQISLENTIDELKNEIEETKNKATILQDQAAEAAEKAASFKAELDANSIIRVSLEKTIDEIERKVQETEIKAISFQDQVAEVTERAIFYQHQASEEAERVTSLKSELEARIHAQVSLENIIDELKGTVQEKETKVAIFQNQTAEATEKIASLKAELEASIDGLKVKVQDTEKKAGQLLTENEIMSKTNSQLKENLEASQSNVHELQELLSSIKEEKVAAAERLSIHERTISDLTTQHSRSLELHSVAESQSKETEAKLCEAVEKLALRDLEAITSSEKLLSLEMQVKAYEERANEAARSAESRKLELEEALLNVKSLEESVTELQSKASEFKIESEGLANANLNLTQELAAYEAKLNNLETAFNGVLADKEETLEQLHASKKTIEDLRGQLVSEGERLQSQISSVMEEKEAAAERLSIHERTISDLTTQHSRSLELHSVAESQSKETEAKLHEAVEKLSLRDLEAITSSEKLLSLEMQVKAYEERANEAARSAESRKVELEEALLNVKSLEESVAELQSKASEFKIENEGLANANLNLTQELAAYEAKLNNLETAFSGVLADKEETLEQLHASKKTIEDLRGQLVSEGERLQSQISSVMEEKAAAVERLSIHERTISDLTTQHSRSLELHSVAESQSKETETKLHEAVEKLALRDLDAIKSSEKLLSLEMQVKAYEERTNEAASSAESRKLELEEALLNVKNLEESVAELQSKASEFKIENEGLANANLNLTQELAAYEAKLNSLETAFSGVLADKEETLEQLYASKKTIEDLRGQLVSEGERLQSQISSVMEEKEAAAERLSIHERTISDLTTQHSRSLELHSVAESQSKETETKLHEAVEKLVLRDLEAITSSEKLLSLEMQVKAYEERANEAARSAESRKVELEEALLNVKSLEESVAELQSKASEFKIENEGLANANLNLTQELAAYEAKLNNLETAFNGVLADKEETVEQLHASKKTIEDLRGQLVSEGERLQSHISSVMEENCLLNEMHQNTKKELQEEISKMTEEVNDHTAKENSLKSHMETLKAEIILMSKMQVTIEELENKLAMAEKQFREEIEHAKLAANEKEQGLMSKLEESVSKLKEIDVLQEQISQFQKDLHLAHATVAELREADSQKELEREASVNLALGEVETKHQHVLALEKQVEDLKQKVQLTEAQYTEKIEASMKQSLEKFDAKHQHGLLLEKQVAELKKEIEMAEAQYNEKDMEKNKRIEEASFELEDLKKRLNEISDSKKRIADLENELEIANSKYKQHEAEAAETIMKDSVVTSRDFELGTTVSKRKGKKRVDVPQQPADVLPANPTTAEEHSLGMTLKFILGIALISMIIGIILGKRY